MTPTWRVLVGDVREKLAELPDQSVQCVVTSPPYWGLRDYGTAKWEGGEPACDHSTPRSRGDDIRPGDKQGTSAGSRPNTQRACACGARRIDIQIGLEPTPDAYVAALVDVFQSVWRVLKDDGVCWLNLGDSYNSGTQFNHHSSGLGEADRYAEGERGDWPGHRPKILNLKSKDLVGIPWRVAFALREDGWYLRSDIIWAKPNPMPESVTDRPTKAHEYIFLLSKRERYYYDADAISESAVAQNRTGVLGYVTPKRLGTGHGQSRTSALDGPTGDTKNARSVWTIQTQPYPEAHFATFPEALPERCIKAGSRLGDTVLDPFTGSGTTGQVAIRLGRSFIGVELNPTYAELARTRIGGAAPLFAVEVPA